MRFGLRKGMIIFLLVFTAICGISIGDDKYILWDYNAYTTNQIGYFEPNAGYVYMVVDLELENHGYSEFNVNPYYFDAIVNNIKYSCDLPTYDDSINTLPDVTLQDGGAISGQIVYQILKGSNEYRIEYSGFSWTDYNFVKK